MFGKKVGEWIPGDGRVVCVCEVIDPKADSVLPPEVILLNPEVRRDVQCVYTGMER